MILNGINIPYNFFILMKNYSNIIIDKNIKDFKDLNLIEYNLLISKVGIFIWDENKKDKFIVYYLYSLIPDELNENKFNKVFIFKTKEDFMKELDEIKALGRYQYFKSRNVQNKNGFYNLNYDGKILGQYINIYINENFKSQYSNDEYNYANNIENMEELDKKKIIIINVFLTNLLTCLSKIKSLKDEAIKIMKLNNKKKNNN